MKEKFRIRRLNHFLLKMHKIMYNSIKQSENKNLINNTLSVIYLKLKGTCTTQEVNIQGQHNFMNRFYRYIHIYA